jgi:O-antigen/teichoic acid export membrane protein
MSLKKILLQSLLWRGLFFFTLLLVNVFLSRYLQASGAGWVYYISNIFSFSLVVIGFSFDAGITYFASNKMIAVDKLVWFTIVWTIILAAIAMAGMFYYIHNMANTLVLPVREYYAIALCYLAGLFITNCCTALFYAENNFFIPNCLLTCWNILFIIIIPKNTVAPELKDAAITLWQYFFVFMVQGISLLATYIFTKRKSFRFSFPSLSELKMIFRYSFLALLANLVFFLVYRIDYLFVNNSPVCTSADLGNYIQVSKLGQMLLIIPQIIASVIFPRTASGIDREKLNQSLMVISRLFSQLFLGILLVVIVAGKWLFTGLFGETFNKMQGPFIVLIPGIFFLSVLNLLSAYFSGKGKVNVNVQGAIIALVVVVIGDYFFVPRYGIIAAAAVSTVGYAVNMAWPLFIFYEDYAVNLFDFFRWRKSDYNWLLAFFNTKNPTE